MKKNKKTRLIFEISFLLIFIFFVVALTTSTVQGLIADYATETLSEYLGAEMKIGRLRIKHLTNIELDDVSLKDKQGEEMVRFDKLAVRMKLLPLFAGELSFREVWLDGLNANLYVTEDSVLNLQFVIDAFPQDTTIKAPDMRFNIVKITNANVRYRDWRTSTDFDVRNLNTEVGFQLKDESHISCEVRSMSVDMKDENVLKNLELKAEINDKMIGVGDLVVDLRNSHVALHAAGVRYAFNKDGSINWGRSSYVVNFAPSTFTPQDISWLVPELRNLNKPAHFELDAKGTIDNIKTDKIHFDYDEDILLDASIDVRNVTDLGKMNASLNIQDIRFSVGAVSKLVEQITNKPLGLPSSLNSLGVCSYKGLVSGSLEEIELVGKLQTAQGSVSTNVKVLSPDTLQTLDIQGTVNTSTINVGKLLPDPQLGLGPTQLMVTTKAHIGKKGAFNITVDGDIPQATFKNYTYRNLNADCILTNKSFDGKVSLDDANAKVRVEGLVSFAEKNEYKIEANIDTLNLGRLNLVENMPDMAVSLDLKTDVWMYDINTINGEVAISDIKVRNGEEIFQEKEMRIVAHNDNDTNYIDISSGLINGNFYGHYLADDIYPNLMKTLCINLPKFKIYKTPEPKKPTDFTASLDIEPLERLMKTLGIPWYTTEATTFHFTYKSEHDRFSSYLIVPHVTNGTMSIDSTILNLNNREKVNINLKTSTDLPIGHLNGKVGVTIDHGVIMASLIWEDNYEEYQIFDGEILAKVTFDITAEKAEPNIEILPTQFVLHGTPWQFSHALIDFKDGEIDIDKFKLASEDGQVIAADGVISEDANDTLDINISNLVLEYVTEMLPEETTQAIGFGGKFSANGYATQLLSKYPHINLTASATPFAFNDVEVGNMKADVSFDTEHNNLGFYATIFNDSANVALLDGHFYFNRDSLDILGKANGLNLAILDKYLKTSVGTVTGGGFGDVHVYSVGKDIAIDGDVLAKDASVGVTFLNSRFYFTDSIHLNRNIIEFPHLTLSDHQGGKGSLTGNIKHKFFQDMEFNILIHCDTIMALNTTKNESPTFYGKVFATGNVAIQGDLKEIDITGRVKTEPRSVVYLSIDNYAATENSFITFVKPVSQKKVVEKVKPASGGNLLVNLMLDISPQTNVQLITNSKTGDKLDARVEGNLRLTFDVNNSDMKLYGDVDVLSGNYVFTLQDIIRKEFKFRNGGKIKFAGDVMSANLDVVGYYQLNANMKDLLDESSLINFERTTVPVQVVLKITGKLTQPVIDFAIELPSSDDELKRLVQTAINTPEKMYREVVALLLISKFIKAESMNNSSFVTQNELYAAVSTTISAQINNWASQMFDKWGFGVNVRKADNSSTTDDNMEYEFNFQYAPTDRLLINGNVGYREGATNNGSSTNFIGDFDVEYKLTEAGQFRVKAYTHTNDYKEYKKGATTQGVGLLWTESFKNGKDLQETIKMQIEKGKRDRALRKKERAEKKKKREEEKAAKEAEKAAKKAEKEAAKAAKEKEKSQSK